MSTLYVLFCFLVQWEFVFGCSSCAFQAESMLKETMKCKSNQIVGLSVSVVRANKVLFQEGYGVMDLETNKSVSENTVFGIASLSKAFASTLLVKLIEEKTKFSLNTPIKTILKNHGVFSDDLRSSYATVRDLLSHRIGIPSHNKIRLDAKLNRANLIHRLKFLKSDGQFRDSFYYSNLMYGVITYMAEIIGGDTWENLVKKYIFDPLGMTSSHFMTTVDPTKIELAKGYVNYYGELKSLPFEFNRRWAELCGSGCILSTAHDMTKWMQFYLREGKLENGTRHVSKGAFNNIIRPENVIHKTYTTTYFSKPEIPETNSQTGYALGWRTGHNRGYNMMIHSGSTFGYRALLSIYPDVDLSIFTAMTGDDPSYLYRQTLHNYLFDTFSAYSPWLNASTICSYPEPWLDAKTTKSKPKLLKSRNPTRPLRSYYGTYSNHAYGQVEIKKHKDVNKLKVEYGFASFVLYPKSTPDQFYGDSTGLTANLFNYYTFAFTFDGHNVSLKIPNFEQKDPPIFVQNSKYTIRSRTSSTTNGCSLFSYSILTLVLMQIILANSFGLLQIK